MGFNTYGATARTLDDTIEDTTDLSVTNEGTSSMSGCCTHQTTCFPQPSDVTINATTLTVGASASHFVQEALTPVANVATLTYTPISDASLLIFINGVMQKNPDDYSRVGTAVTFTGTLPSDELTVIAVYIATDASGISLSMASSGFMVAWAATVAVPAGWLECDGSAISRTSYADLFAAIGTTYGVGDGSTTFNLPDVSDSHYDPGSGTLVNYTAIIKI